MDEKKETCTRGTCQARYYYSTCFLFSTNPHSYFGVTKYIFDISDNHPRRPQQHAEPCSQTSSFQTIHRSLFQNAGKRIGGGRLALNGSKELLHNYITIPFRGTSACIRNFLRQVVVWLANWNERGILSCFGSCRTRRVPF